MPDCCVSKASRSPDKLISAIDLIVEQLHDLAENPIDEEELWKTKMQLKGQFELSGDSPHTRMCRLATQETYFSDILGEQVLDGIESLRTDQIRNCAQQIMNVTPSCGVLIPSELCINENELRGRLGPMVSI